MHTFDRKRDEGRPILSLKKKASLGVDTSTIEGTHRPTSTMGFKQSIQLSLAESLHTTSFVGTAHKTKTIEVVVAIALTFEFAITHQNVKKIVKQGK